MNNTAVHNLWQKGPKAVKRDRSESLWQNISQLTFNKYMQTEIMTKFRMFRDQLNLQQLKELNTPFKFLELKELQRLLDVAERIERT